MKKLKMLLSLLKVKSRIVYTDYKNLSTARKLKTKLLSVQVVTCFRMYSQQKGPLVCLFGLDQKQTFSFGKVCFHTRQIIISKQNYAGHDGHVLEWPLKSILLLNKQ